MNRLSTGIDGLDKLIEGGVPERSLTLLSGPSGAGKTVFSLQFLYANSEREPGIYVSFEEEMQQIKEMTDCFRWDIEELEKQNKLRFLKYDPFLLEDIFEIIEGNIREMGAKRVVIDSISSLGIYVKDQAELRRMILQINNILRKNGCTSLLVSEILVGENVLSRFGVEEFITDGVIVLHNILASNEYKRGINVWKMQATNHSRFIHPYKITENGFVVFPESVFIS